MSALTRDAILAGAKLRVELVPVPRLSGDVYLREITGAERDQLEQWIATESQKNEGKPQGLPNVRARVAWHCLSDKEGNRLFTKVAEIEQLGALPAQALDTIFDKATAMNALFNAAEEEIAKN